MKKLLLASAISTALLTAGCSQPVTETSQETSAQQAAVAGDVIKSPNDQRDYRVLTLDNNIEIMLVSDPNTDKSAASLSVGVGLLQDPETQQGMAHYLEHMLFLGTDKYPDTSGYSEFMSNNGGSQNAYTWLDITNYMFKVNNDAYNEGLDRFSDFFKAPKLYPEYVDKERNAVNAEWSMRREMDFFGQFKLGRLLLGKHPSNRFLIGNLESLSDKENSKLHQETVDFYNRYYSSNIMKVAMISNRSLDEMEKLARKHFATIEDDGIDKPEVTAEINFEDVGGKRIHYVPNEDVKQLKLEFIINDNQDQFAAKPNQYVSYLLGSEMPGTPAQKLKEAGLIANLNVSAQPTFYGNYGALTVDVELTNAGMKQRDDIVALIMQYTDKVRAKGVDEKYFKEIQTSLNNRFRFLEKGDEFGYVSNLAEAMQNYPAKYAISAPYEYQEFNPEAIRSVLSQLTSERLRVWYISQDEPHDSQLDYYEGKYKVVDIPQDEIASWDNQPEMAINLPKVNTLLPESFAIKQNKAFDKPQVVLEENGIQVWQYPSQVYSEQPRGVFSIEINNPLPIEDIKANVLTAIWRDLYNLNNSALDTEANIAGMNLSLTDNVGLNLQVSGFTDKQPQLLERAVNNLSFTVEEQAFNQAVNRYIRELQNKGQQFPIYQGFDAYSQLIKEGGFGKSDLIQTAQSLRPGDLTEFMDKLLSHNDIRVFAFGNYNQEDLKESLNRIQTSLPDNRKVTDFERAHYWKPEPGKSIVLRRDLDVADVALVDAHFHPQPGFENLAAGTVLQSDFRTAAFDTLRTEEQLAYAVGAFAPSLDHFAGFGLYIQTPVKSVAEMQERFTLFKQEYWKDLQEMSPEEFEQIKQSTLITLKEKPKNLDEEVSPLLADLKLHRFEFNSKEQLIEAVEGLTLEDAKAFYQQTMLNPDAARISVQLRGTKFAEQPYADIPNQTVISDLAEFQQEMEKQ
ncbi:insulinase family protein [Idiomarina sp. HP20-50]|uniref:insulinase family protein n=1 Tax=Idiomarina sp. HP20-50 TaxID=3070813 RepID=UPI00294AAEC4|nr:insulinase family protein [Idiomarina sp. HP20-50]MDV6316773.1 insulinase family protein [Idiomarina sp. HP20-50]